MSDDANKRGSYHHGDLRQALIDEALVIIGDEGMRGLSLRKLARRVGVTHSAPYRHFNDKAELFTALALEGFDRLHQAQTEAAEAAGPVGNERLHALGRAYVQFAVSHPAHFRVMWTQARADGDPRVHQAYKDGVQLLVDTVALCQAQGLAREGDPEELARAAWSLVHGISSLYVSGIRPAEGPEAMAAEVERMGRLLFIGLRKG